MDAFLTALRALPSGYFKATYKNVPYGVTVERRADGRQIKLYGEALGKANHVSFNLYLTSSGKTLLKPCEMPSVKVMDFVLGVVVVA